MRHRSKSLGCRAVSLLFFCWLGAMPVSGAVPAATGNPRPPTAPIPARSGDLFEDVTARAGITFVHQFGHERIANILLSNGAGGAVFDYDNDGWVDLFLLNWGPLAGATDPARCREREPNRLYRNRGDGTFEDATRAAGLWAPRDRAMSVSAFDCDGDGDTDLYVSNDDTPNALWLNDGQGRFRNVATETGVAFNSIGEAPGSMNAAVADVNFDGLPDLYITRLGYGSLYVRSSAGYYDDRMWASGLGLLTQSLVGWGGVFLDMDNDTDPDLCIVNGSAFVLTGSVTLLLENDGQGRFTDAGNRGGVFFRTPVNGRGNAVLDYDNDGRLDLLLTLLADRPMLLRNRASGDRRWLKLQLEGTRSNRNGYGALITLSAGGRVHQAEAMCPAGFLMQSDARVHFGLDTATRVDRIEIRWPSGVRQVLEDLPVDQILKVREPLP